MECHKEYPYKSIDITIFNDINYYQYYYQVSKVSSLKYKLVEDCKILIDYSP